METLKRLILIAALTGLVSGPWLGAIEPPSAPSLLTDAVVGAAVRQTADAGTPGAVFPDVSITVASTVMDDEATPEAAPVRRGGGGTGKALKK